MGLWGWWLGGLGLVSGLAGKIPCAHFPAQWTNPSPLPSPLPYPSPPAPARFMKHDNHIRRTAQGISAHGNNASRNAYNSITISFWYFASFVWWAGWKYWILQFFLACMQLNRRDNIRAQFSIQCCKTIFNCAEHNFQFTAAKLYSLAGKTTQQQQNPIPPTQFRTTIQFTGAQRANPQGHCP